MQKHLLKRYLFEFNTFVKLPLFCTPWRDSFHIDILLVHGKSLSVHQAAEEFIFAKVSYRGRVHII